MASAEFIVGNPPFIGASFLRARLGDAFTEALWAAHPHMNECADFVMYWWDRAAELLMRKGTVLRRFGSSQRIQSRRYFSAGSWNDTSRRRSLYRW